LVYEALLTETKGRAFITDTLLFNWGEPADLNAPTTSGPDDQIRRSLGSQKPRLADTARPSPGGYRGWTFDGRMGGGN